MSPLSWRRALREDLPGLSAFLREREERCAGFTGRILRGGELRLPSPLHGAVWIAPSDDESGALKGALKGALLCHPSRIAFPVLPPREDPPAGVRARAPERDGDAELALVSGSWRPASAIGMAEDVARYEAALGMAPQVSVAYRLMSRSRGSAPGAASGAAPSAAPRGLTVRRALPSDLEGLLPLQEAYEREEVLTEMHAFNAAACRAALAKAIERQLVFLAEARGAVLGKAGTNARGFRVDQIGGVFVPRASRGRGIGRALMLALLAELDSQGKDATLFVKPANAPAIALYRSLGFAGIGDFAADYYPD